MISKQKLVLPAFRETHRFSDFLCEFVNINKSKHRYFSHRWLAKSLKWPVSYCSDVIAGRKPMTIVRALEFAQFLKMDTFEIERLILMVLSENSSDLVKQFAIQLAENYRSPDHTSSRVLADVLHEVDLFLLNELAAHWMATGSKKGFVENIRETCPSLGLSTEQINAKLERMKQLKMIVVHEDGSVSQGENPGGLLARGTLLEFRQIHSQYAAYLERAVSAATKPSPAYGGFLRLPESKMVEVTSKFRQVQNWLVHVCQEYEKSAAQSGPAEDEQVFLQMTYLLPLLKKP
jgi:hypothetical protein